MIQQQLITMEACFPTALRCCRPGHVPFLRPPSADLQHTIRSVLLWSAGGGTDTKVCHFVLSVGSNSKTHFPVRPIKKIIWKILFFFYCMSMKMDFLFTALQIRENFGQFLHGNWNNKLGREKKAWKIHYFEFFRTVDFKWACIKMNATHNLIMGHFLLLHVLSSSQHRGLFMKPVTVRGTFQQGRAIKRSYF